MISVVIPTLNAERHLPVTLAALVPAVVDGLVCQVVVADGGSTDHTVLIADGAGADIVHVRQGRGEQLAAGACSARGRWLLFLHADTMLGEEWVREVRDFIDKVEGGGRAVSAASFRFKVDDEGVLPRLLEAGVAARCAVFKLPYGDQALLIPRQLYDAVGGYNKLPLMEDVDIVRRLGRKRIRMLRSCAVTSADKFRCDGYLRRSVRNVSCLVLYRLGAPMSYIQRVYQGRNDT